MTTETLISALRQLSKDIYSEDGVANAAIAEAADKLSELHNSIQGLCEHFGAEGIVDLGVKLLRLERERDAERALADALGNSIYRYLPYTYNNYYEMTKAIEAWKEARND